MTVQPLSETGVGPARRATRVTRWLVLAASAVGIGLLLWSRRPEQPATLPAKPTSVVVAAVDPLEPARKLMQEGDFEGALVVTDALLAEQPDNVEALLLHSEVLFRLYRSDEMIPYLEHALALQSDRFEVHANLAFALRFAGRLDEAEREAQWCLARQPDHAAVRRVLAEIRRDQGDYAAALDEVRMALRTAPRDLGCRLLEADLLLFARKFEDAYQRLRPLREDYDHSGRYLSALARAAQMSGRTGEAAECRAALHKLNESE